MSPANPLKLEVIFSMGENYCLVLQQHFTYLCLKAGIMLRTSNYSDRNLKYDAVLIRVADLICRVVIGAAHY